MKGLFAALMLAALAVRAESPYPLRVGNNWEYTYRNVITYPMGDNVMTNVTVGTMSSKIVGMETTNGVTYFKAETDYHGMFNLPKQYMLLREDDAGIYSASDLLGSFSESLTIALPLEVGRKWEYFDGVAGWRKCEAIETVEQDGKRYDDCYKITREFKDPEKAKTMVNTSWYAPGFGEVRFYLKQELGPTLSLTETFLTSFTAGP